jgi:hypothetical protein
MAATEAAKLETPLARREMIRALERGLVVVLERPGRTDITFADDRPTLAIVPRGQLQRISVTRASEYLGFSVSAKPYVHADLGARAWHQM